MRGIPTFIRNGRLDVLAINALGQMLYSEAFVSTERPVNMARFCRRRRSDGEGGRNDVQRGSGDVAAESLSLAAVDRERAGVSVVLSVQVAQRAHVGR